jgi:hypothetical protein
VDGQPSPRGSSTYIMDQSLRVSESDRCEAAPSDFHRGDELGVQFLPLALPRLQILDTLEHLCLKPEQVEAHARAEAVSG